MYVLEEKKYRIMVGAPAGVIADPDHPAVKGGVNFMCSRCKTDVVLCPSAHDEEVDEIWCVHCAIKDREARKKSGVEPMPIQITEKAHQESLQYFRDKKARSEQERAQDTKFDELFGDLS